VSLEETQVENRWRVGDQLSCETQVDNRWVVGDQLSVMSQVEETQVENRLRVGDQLCCGVSLEETQVQNRWRVLGTSFAMVRVGPQLSICSRPAAACISRLVGFRYRG